MVGLEAASWNELGLNLTLIFSWNGPELRGTWLCSIGVLQSQANSRGGGGGEVLARQGYCGILGERLWLWVWPGRSCTRRTGHAVLRITCSQPSFLLRCLSFDGRLC